MQVTIMRLLCVLIIVGGFFSAAFAQLTSSDVERMSKNADIIITGKVTQQSSSWNESNTRIYTQATIQVEEYLKGNSNGNSLNVIYPGGEVGDVGEMYSHMPRFVDQEEVLVFLQKDQSKSDYKVLYGEEGKISIIDDPKTGEKITTSNVRINSLKTQIKSYIAE